MYLQSTKAEEAGPKTVIPINPRSERNIYKFGENMLTIDKQAAQNIATVITVFLPSLLSKNKVKQLGKQLQSLTN